MSMMTSQTSFEFSLEQLILESAEAVRPAKRMSISQAAEEYRHLNNPGSYVGPWLNEVTPYLVEPMDVLQSQKFTGMAFAGPAQTGKTDMVINWVTYSTICDPADMMIVQTSQTTSRDFSIRRVDRLHRHSPAVGAMLAAGTQSDNTFDKQYRSGMMLSMSWPAINELSGKPIPRLWLTDYDRMPQNIDGEGSPFSLARKRATTFRSHGMCAAESSPGYEVENPKWIKTSPHEAPPTKGILAIYNQGDRRLWYWQCVDCRKWFEPDFELLVYPDIDDAMEAAESAHLCCPHCEAVYHHDPVDGRPGKHELNKAGKWVPDNCWIDENGDIHGKPIRSTIASFWLKGVAAAFSDWKTLVFNFITAEREYESNQSEEALKTTVNTDQGKPYVPKSMRNDRVPEVLKARAKPLAKREVPMGVRFLIACIDVQKNRFVVQVHGIHANRDISVIDRFEIKKSKRKDADGERHWVNPGAHPEDWKLIVEEVMEKTYPLIDGSGRHMGIKMTVSDSGGKEGTTANAYDFYRWLKYGDREEEGTSSGDDEAQYLWKPGLAGRFMLLKGASTKTAPRVALSYPDSQRKDRHAGARGEVPVLMMNTNTLKDSLSHMLDRVEPGNGVLFPDWLDDNFFIELTVEVRDPAKGWINPKRFRNESWDLLTYCLAAQLTAGINIEHINWQDPPPWAEDWGANDLVFDPEVEDKPFDAVPKNRRSLKELASALA
ncbi:terminase large subunit [Synechococcus virus S-ESS1]|uniref:Terminase, large subunit n=1 Tax=Synechococcus virus S-ESS1 TaxID=1964565 RepID=A0A1V0DX24_9CAUD|nr:terminase large subunit [Synechococcus virus S-ESS1]ARB05712.1 terminase large subunit [Synechococcus virus S-ESS1]